MTTSKPTKTIAQQATAQLNGSQDLQSALLESESASNLEQSASEYTADILPEYSELDRFIEKPDKTSDTGEVIANENSENSQGMSSEDAYMFAAGGVGYLESLSSAYVGAEITLPEAEKERVAEKAGIVIKKYFGNAELPPWLVKYKEEIDLGVALGACVFSVYKQKKAFDAEQESEPSETKSEVIANPVTDEMANDVYDYSMSEALSGNQ